MNSIEKLSRWIEQLGSLEACKLCTNMFFCKGSRWFSCVGSMGAIARARDSTRGSGICFEASSTTSRLYNRS